MGKRVNGSYAIMVKYLQLGSASVALAVTIKITHKMLSITHTSKLLGLYI